MSDKMLSVLDKLVLGTEPSALPDVLSSWRSELRTTWAATDETGKLEIADALMTNAIDLCSGLTDWKLKCNRFCDCKPCTGLSETALQAESNESINLLRDLGCEPQAAAAESEIAALKESNLLKLTRMSLFGNCNTWWGNDYATGLRASMRRGAAMVTTNPVLVNLARKEDPDTWTPVRDSLQEAHPNYSPTELAYALTIQVVTTNAKMLRPIWTATDGAMGYTSLQLSPKNATDADQMIKEAKWVWGQLEQELEGTPNCVFKVPGTRAGIEVAAELTRCAMGVNVTVNFSLPQQIAFAGAIENNSTAKISYRTQMDGRLDDPVGDELQAFSTDWENIKTWCTTVIRQREYRLLHFTPARGGLGMNKSIPLPASGRGPWNILRSVHSEPEVPLFLTVFPNRQTEFDEMPREIAPDGMWESLPTGYLDTLNKSKLFRQAYEPDGMTVDEFDTYLPVVATLTQFNEGYDEFVAWVSG